MNHFDGRVLLLILVGAAIIAIAFWPTKPLPPQEEAEPWLIRDEDWVCPDDMNGLADELFDWKKEGL